MWFDFLLKIDGDEVGNVLVKFNVFIFLIVKCGMW